MKIGWHGSSSINSSSTEGYMSKELCSSSEASVATESTALSSEGKAEDSLRRWLVSKTRPIRESIFPRDHAIRQASNVMPERPPQETLKPKQQAATRLEFSTCTRASTIAQQIVLAPSVRLVIVQFEPTWSINCVLSQVCGGPLEKVNLADNNLELHFLHSACAQRFYYYAKSGQFTVRGRALKVGCPTDVSLSISGSEDKMRDEEFEQAILGGARRTLTVSQRVHSPTQRLTPSKICIRELKAMFESMGRVLLVRPMFTRKGEAFVIQYEDISSAIRAKHALDHNLAPFSSLHRWKSEYIKDSTERPCVFA